MIKFSNQQLAALAEIRGLGLDAVSVRSPAPAAAGPKTARGADAVARFVPGRASGTSRGMTPG